MGEDMNRREMMSKVVAGGAAAAVGLSETAEAQTRQERVGNVAFSGFEKSPENLEAVKQGLQTALRLVENELSKEGRPISCAKMPFFIGFRHDGKAGILLGVETVYRGQKMWIQPNFNMPSLHPGPIDALDFARWLRDSLLERKDQVREICSQ